MTTNGATPDYSLFIHAPGGAGRQVDPEIVAFVSGLTDGIPQQLPADIKIDPMRRHAFRTGRVVTIRHFGGERWVCAIKPEDHEAVKALTKRKQK